jgi:hypothetical protein
VAGSIASLDSAYRDALRVVFGLDVAVTPDRYTLGNAFLELVRRESAGKPVLLLVDDLQWLDLAVPGRAGRASFRPPPRWRQAASSVNYTSRTIPARHPHRVTEAHPPRREARGQESSLSRDDGSPGRAGGSQI